MFYTVARLLLQKPAFLRNFQWLPTIYTRKFSFPVLAFRNLPTITCLNYLLVCLSALAAAKCNIPATAASSSAQWVPRDLKPLDLRAKFRVFWGICIWLKEFPSFLCFSKECNKHTKGKILKVYR